MRRSAPRHPPPSPGAPAVAALKKGLMDVFAHMGEALRLVWTTHRGLTVALGLLALGSREPDTFHPGQATELLCFLTRVIERCIRSWLDLPP